MGSRRRTALFLLILLAPVAVIALSSASNVLGEGTAAYDAGLAFVCVSFVLSCYGVHLYLKDHRAALREIEEASAARDEAERQRIERIRNSGRRGRAAILKVVDLGSTLNDGSPEVQLDLEVSVEETGVRAAPYVVQHREYVPRLAVARLIPGSTVPVFVDPAAADQLIVGWEIP